MVVMSHSVTAGEVSIKRGQKVLIQTETHHKTSQNLPLDETAYALNGVRGGTGGSGTLLL